MKAIVGVDLQGNWKNGLELADKFKFEDCKYHFLNAVEPILPDGSFPELSVSNPLTEILDELTAAGNKVISEATSSYPESTSSTRFGTVAVCLEEEAKAVSADLLIVGSHKKSLLETFFAGSVTRSLAISSEQSVLIGKKSTPNQEKLTVVFAHDMSEYADSTVDRLVNLAPRGIGKIILLTANTTEPSLVAIIERESPSMSGETLDIIEAHIRKKQDEIVARLQKICPDVEAQIIAGDPKNVIREVMNNSKADALILGAHGHNFVERLMMGSVALHTVLRENFNVFLLRK